MNDKDTSSSNAQSPNTNGIEIRIKGKVQGVGFRPYVWQLANSLQLLGNVSNDGSGVIVHLYNNAQIIPTFLEQLPLHCPPLASIQAIHTHPFHWETPPQDFIITHSGEGQMDTHIVPDAATCPACLAELNTATDRRYHYPFTNCTHCGPRFTIIKHIPYDRANTSMKAFPLCPQCAAEYQNPADRRFHAQPNACPQCGPRVWLCQKDGTPLAYNDQAIHTATQALAQGKIVAVKGMGGFHLACDATQQSAVLNLRQRKHRPSKPLAVMLPDEKWLTRCVTTPDITPLLSLLTSPAAPIVLVQQHPQSPLCSQIAPQLQEVGVMLPANPLQHLLMQQCQKPLVMTSGNAHGKPPAQSNEDALAMLDNMADLWLMHDRDIVQRADDSVVRFTAPSAEILRRARGYVPDAIELPDGFQNSPSLLALGGDLKNTFCLLRDANAIISQHLGDLSDIDIAQQVEQSIALFQDIYQFTPEAIVTDAHPAYVSRQMGATLAKKLNIPHIETTHHHAHIVSCMAEHTHPRTAGPVIGLALDGLGYGTNGNLWGGECLLVDYAHCQHLGGLPAVALPGGDLAARQPWRNLLAQLLQFVPQWQNLPEAKTIPAEQTYILEKAIAQGINTPAASSAGRLFDAIAAALEITPQHISWESEAAASLETLATQCFHQTPSFIPPVTMPILDNGTLDLATFWQQWLSFQAPKPQRAYAFHYALAQGFAQLARQAATQHGISTIALAGGVMHNALLRQLLTQQLQDLQVWLPTRLPAGDGGISLGQALIAATQFTP